MSQPVQEMRRDRQIFPPSFITAIARHSLAPSLRPANTLLFMIWLRIHFPYLVFWCYFPFVCISFLAVCETLEQRCVYTTFRCVCLPFCSLVQSNPLPSLLLVPDEFEVTFVMKSINLSRARLHAPSSSSWWWRLHWENYCCWGVIWITS